MSSSQIRNGRGFQAPSLLAQLMLVQTCARVPPSLGKRRSAVTVSQKGQRGILFQARTAAAYLRSFSRSFNSDVVSVATLSISLMLETPLALSRFGEPPLPTQNPIAKVSPP